MSATFLEHERHIFPRWRSFVATSRLGELALPPVAQDIDTSALDLSLANGIVGWQKSPSLWYGLDLLGTAIVAGRLQEFPALVAEVKNNPLVPQIARNLLESIQTPEPIQLDLPEYGQVSNYTIRKEIRTHRLNLGFAPRDAIEWVELARAYTIAGINEKAHRAIAAALQLAPDNRFVLRSAARFLIHIGESDSARALLNRTCVIGHDSWIMASEIAIADSLGKTSKFSGLARAKMQADIAPSELSELASALGSMEAESGNHKMARRYLRRALVEPNENSIAQIQWLNRSHLAEAIDTSAANPPLLHEARALASFHAGAFKTARAESLNWLRDQPFASAPAILSCYILSDIFGDFEGGKAIAHSALKANPDDPTLLNNLAVCLMELGERKEADEALNRLKAEIRDKPVNATYNATFGMQAFRDGNFEEGRKLYLEAIAAAFNSNDKPTAARAAIHLFYEESLAETSKVEEAANRAREIKSLQESTEITWLFDRIAEAIETRRELADAANGKGRTGDRLP